MNRHLLALVAFLVVACSTPPAATLSPLATPYRQYLPIVAVAKPTATPPPPPTPTPCFTNEKAAEFANLLISDARQRRTVIRCDPRLVAAAQARAAALIRDGNWAHADAAGIWANDYARAAGCVLPSTYGDRNNIESLVAGSPLMPLMFTVLANSPAHAAHLFGQGDFFLAQNQIGVAYAEGGRFGFYIVVFIGHCVN